MKIKFNLKKINFEIRLIKIEFRFYFETYLIINEQEVQMLNFNNVYIPNFIYNNYPEYRKLYLLICLTAIFCIYMFTIEILVNINLLSWKNCK